MKTPYFASPLILGLGLPHATANIVNTVGTVTYYDLMELADPETGEGIECDAFSARAQIVYSLENESDTFDLLHSYESVNVNLMLPPDGFTDLCEFPEDKIIAYNQTNEVPMDHDVQPIALLVPLQRKDSGVDAGQCDIARKIEVALQYQETLTQKFTAIIFYNAPYDLDGDSSTREDYSFRPTQLYPITVPEDANIPGLESLVLTTISHRTAFNIVNRMKNSIPLQNTDAALPMYLMNEGNEKWQFPISLERGTDSGPLNNPWLDDDDEGSDSWARYSFVWFRFALFVMIFCIPLVRCGLLFYRGGGRITWRRNDNGRIVGLAYIPPEQHWARPDLTGDGGGNARPRKKKLTKEEVMELPEIVYEGTNEDDSQREFGDDETHDITVKTGSEDETAADETAEASDVNTDAAKSKLEISVIDGDERRYTNTTSTTCAICIDAFEHGENIRLLPRCGHAYHTDCILPWLTTREACCPFCKTLALRSLEDENDQATDGENNESSQEQAPAERSTSTRRESESV